MRSFRITRSDLYHIIIRSAAVYFFCLIVSVIFLVNTRHGYEGRVKQQQPVLLENARERMEAWAEGMLTLTAQMGDELGRISEDNPAAYKRILSRTRSLGGFEAVLYITEDDRVYTDEGKAAAGSLANQIERMREAGLETVHTVEGLWEEGDRFLMFPVPVTQENGSCGTLVALCDCSEMMDDPMFNELREESACYLIENDGLVLSFSEHESLDINYAALSNFYMQMYDLTQGDSASKSRVQKMRHSTGETDMQSIHITAGNSHDCIVMLARIQNLDGYSIAAVTDMKEQSGFLDRFLGRAVLTFLILFALSVLSIVLIWFYVKGVTARMEALAYTDDVTKGKNVNYFRREAMKLLELHSETPYIIQRFDISNFRYLNEAYGHLRADEILKACVTVYQKIYSEKELCVRMDSDQFLTLTVNDNEVNERRESYIREINEYAVDNGIRYPIRMKYGVYQLRKQDRDIDVMIDRANAARRSLNGNETDYVAYYTDAIIRDMRKVDKIESEMQHALDTGEFKVFLQAKWDIVNDRVAGAEALVRWIRPEGNMVFPDEFIPVFEKNGFIERLDFYMLESVIKKMREVMEAGGTVYPVSVNQSRILLHNPEYLERIRQLFDSYQVPKEYIELEVTETALFDDRKRMVSVLRELKKEGVKLSMDDFGSGYSSLNTLKDMPFDVLKIDKEFFSEAVTSDSSTLILQKIIEMAAGLGMEVICEGVENEQQVALLRKIGCKRVQGYYYARPEPIDRYIGSYCMIPGVS